MRLRAYAKLAKRFGVAWMFAMPALLGVASALAQLFPSVAAPSVNAVAITIGSALIAAVYVGRNIAPDHLPLSDLLPDSLESFPTISLECTTDRAAILEVHRLTEEVYPGVDPLPADRYEEWLGINPQMFVCLFDSSRRVLGYFDVFPLEANFMAELVAGRVGEHDIRKEHILAPEDGARAIGLYLAGVAVRDWHRHESKRYAGMLVWGMLKYFDHH